jgi:hypothetical protein
MLVLLEREGKYDDMNSASEVLRIRNAFLRRPLSAPVRPRNDRRIIS